MPRLTSGEKARNGLNCCQWARRSFTAIDECTRLRILRAYPRYRQKTFIQFIDYVLAKLPFGVECVQRDNGHEFGSAFH